MTRQEYLDQLIDAIKNDCISEDVDNDGQIIIYTNVYRMDDGSYSNDPIENNVCRCRRIKK
jgi:hypothetical protein